MVEINLDKYCENVAADKKKMSEKLIDQIIDTSYDAIFVTDSGGYIMMINPAVVRLLQIPYDELMGINVKELLKRGVYDRSTALEAVTRRMMITGLVRTSRGINLMSTSTPLFDEEGNVTMVVTNSRDKDLVDKFIATLEQERALATRYKQAVEYLGRPGIAEKQIVADSPAMRQIIVKATVIAKADSTVLITGESGTGKEVIAKFIRRNSLRLSEPFIPVNCAAIPAELMESEFFGYVKGAFTGANSQGKPGFFEMADKGTLFLDEIAEMPLNLQSKLLRVIETSEVKRIGGTSVQTTDVRIIAATNQNLKNRVDAGQFREDLYYRLNVIPIVLPPLRERPGDILGLAQKFVDQFNRKYTYHKVLSEKTREAFLAYSWPGNVRELRNVVERLVITSNADELDFWEDAGCVCKEHPLSSGGFGLSYSDHNGSLQDLLTEVEASYISKVLKDCGGCVSEAANILGIHRSALYRKIQRPQKGSP